MKKFIQNYVDAMPSGDAKKAICEEYTYLRYDSRPFGLFPYHNNYRSDAKREALFKGPANLFMKGYRPVYKVTNVDVKDIDKERVEAISNEANEFLSTLISTCKKYDNIKFIFGKMPRFHSTESDAVNSYQMRYVKNILLESGFDFYDFCDYVSDMGLDHSADMYDNEHLNHNGAKKFTKFFGSFLLENSFITVAKHSDEIVNSYDECYLKYKAEVNENE